MFLPGVSCARLANARTGDTDVAIGLERAVGSLVACNSEGHVLTCHSNSNSLVLAVNNIVLSIASIS